MAKIDISTIQGIDDIDRTILYMLYEDARVSYTEIAEKVELTRPAVKNRIKAMEDKGIIVAYRAIVNPKPDDTGIKFMLSVVADPKYFLEVADKIAMFKIHRQVYSKTGLNNIVAFGYAADSKALKDYERSVYSKIRQLEGVNEIALHQLITTYKDVDGGVDYDAERFKPLDGDEQTEG